MASKLSKWEMAGIGIGVLGALFAIPKTIVDSWQALTSSPAVTAEATSPLRMTYDPRNKVVLFSFGALLHNEGSKAERIGDVNAHLHAGGTGDVGHPFNITQMKFKDGDAEVPIKLPIAKESHRILTCEITSFLTNELATVLRHPNSRRDLQVEFAGSKMTYMINFQFDLSKETLDALLTSRTSRTLQFIGSDLK